jgi:hypothetical protein
MFRPYSNNDVNCFLQYPLYNVMVFDNWTNTIHMVIFVILRPREKDFSPVLQALHDKVQRIKHDWNPSSIIVDNAQAEIIMFG